MQLLAANESTTAKRACLLLAVSKTKPVEDVQAAYDAGQRAFGENYVEEFVEKAPKLPNDIKWHFVGHIQSNKAKKLVSIPNLALVETVDTEKLANTLNKELAKIERAQPLPVLVQVHSGGEASKYGAQPDEVPALVNHIQAACPQLKFSGLMSMGLLHDIEGFKTMAALKNDLLDASGLTEETFHLSMGTSADYEEAVMHGATEVRLGTTIFGAREYPDKK